MKKLHSGLATAICISTLASLKSIPSLGAYGASLLFYFLVAIVLALAPTAIISSYLSTSFVKEGAVYTWVSEAFGERYGFLAIFAQWISNVIWFPTALSFAISAMAFVINPSFAGNQLLMVSAVLISFWLLTFVNVLGYNLSYRISAYGVIIGTIFPAVFVIALGGVWFLSSQPDQIVFSTDALFPDMTEMRNWTFLSAVVVSFLGIEMISAHVTDFDNPQENYPKVIFRTMIVVTLLFALGSLCVANVIPKSEFQTDKAALTAIKVFFKQYHIEWMGSIVAFLMGIGAFATINTWIIGPTRVLHRASLCGALPRFFHKRNEYGMPSHLLSFQAIVVTIISLLLLMLPNPHQIFWVSILFTSQIFMLMYCLMFAAAVVLMKRGTTPYKWWVVPSSMLGVIGSVGAFVIGFIPPDFIPKDWSLLYIIIYSLGLIFFTAIPFAISYFRKDSWRANETLNE